MREKSCARLLDSRARALEGARGELRTRAERAEHDVDQARAELKRLRQVSADNA